MKLPITSYNEQTKIDLDAVPTVDVCSDTTPCSNTTECSSTTSCSDTTETQRVNKWRTETKDTIRFDVKKGTKSFLQNEASKRGMTLTQLLKESVKLYLSIK
jgi:hypothetical protein